MKRLLFIILIFNSFSISAQYKQAPDIYKERNEVNPQILKGSYKGFKVVEFGLLPNGMFDTTAIYDHQYYPSGLIMENSHYDYEKPGDKTGIPTGKKLSSQKEGNRTKYTYDAMGNLLCKKTYELFPANSLLALMATTLKPDENEDSENPGNSKMDKGKEDIDSLLAAGVPEFESITSQETFTYNKDGNPIYSKDSVKQTETKYRYTYDKKKRVSIKRKTTDAGYLSVYEYHFGYDKRNNPDTITVYECKGDTTNVTAPKNITYATRRKYNAKNKITSEAFDVHNFRDVFSKKNLYTYRDTLIMSVITLNANNDTEALYENVYNQNNKLSEQNNYLFKDGKRYMLKRQVRSYDSSGNVSEVRYIQRNPLSSPNETLYKKELFFLYK